MKEGFAKGLQEKNFFQEIPALRCIFLENCIYIDFCRSGYVLYNLNIFTVYGKHGFLIIKTCSNDLLQSAKIPSVQVRATALWPSWRRLDVVVTSLSFTNREEHIINFTQQIRDHQMSEKHLELNISNVLVSDVFQFYSQILIDL